ncbi:hypothetical protein AMELA_G00278300 [Ameiurus melas]|uniref:MARVEL domain-containing protein n=1 Tax=Ameiurus melas TaxID=219545 RepID=A0A7J5ZLP3_AMEME|nr:hypothetical protein AMELA_G00278300 [Ameiurus melas]
MPFDPEWKEPSECIPITSATGFLPPGILLSPGKSIQDSTKASCRPFTSLNSPANNLDSVYIFKRLTLGSVVQHRCLIPKAVTNDQIIGTTIMSEARSHRGHRERQGRSNRESRQQQQQQQQQQHRTRPSSNNRPSTRSQQSTRNQSTHSQYGRRVTSEEVHGSKCTHMCSRRGIVLMCAFLSNLLVLFCIVAAFVSQSGMSVANFGGGNFVDVVIPFEGTELQQVRDLDMQFSQMRAPGIYGGLPFSITFGVLLLFFVISGNKPAHVLSRKLLIGQFAFQLFGAVAYVVAVGLYLHFVIMVNSTDVCLQRERLYGRNGQTWMNCSVNGGDASVALFGIITAILFAIGAFFTARTIHSVNQYNKDRVRYEAERPKQPHSTQDTPLQSGIYI